VSLSQHRRCLDLLAHVEKLEFEPGEKFEYSNSGYVILAQIVERSPDNGSPLPPSKHFKPLGMKRTILYDEPTNDS
jgi:CubicO group peptidase (beta-lactamase class C family)